MNFSSGKDATNIPKGKTCIVTGATSGIGREIALGLSRLANHVTIVGRSKEKCQSVADEIVSATTNSDISFEVADLSSMNSVRKLADRLSSSNPGIDVLINNAGAFFSKHALTDEGFERTMALNYLSPVLLTRLLLPSFKSKGDSRIINTGSSLHTRGRPEFDFKYPWKYSSMKAYSTSKLMITMFSYSLSERLSGTGISVSVVEPGFVATNLGKNSGSGLLSASFSLMRPFQISANEAAKTSVYLATSANPLDINGKCFSRMKHVQTSEISHDKKKQDELWQQTTEALALPNDI